VSAGFVHAVLVRSDHAPVVVSRDGLIEPDAFPGPPVSSLAWANHVRPERLARAARSVALGRVARRHDAVAVHAHFGYAAHDVLGLVAHRHLPLVLSLHGDDVTALPARHAGHYDALVGRVDALVVPSHWLAARTAELGFPPERTHVIPSGVDLEHFTPTPVPTERRTVAFVGRFVEKKGLDVLLAAWPMVRAAIPDAELHVLGDGALLPLVAAQAANPSSRVTCHRPDPMRRHEQVRDLLRDATVVATPSRTAGDGDAESLLLVNLEAQASGRAVVTTRHGGIPEFVEEGKTALVVAPDDADALADALVAVLHDPALAGRMGAAGPAVAARFSLDAAGAAVDRVYDSLLEASPRNR
jgi:glycosyltransferase involved in cell wall biosynthesis